MREPTKNKFRVATFIIGGVLTITGIISGSYALIQIPDGASLYMPYVLISILTLSLGIYLCFGPIKLPHYFVKSRKMPKEEKVIENIKKYMKKGKGRIVAFTILLVFMIATSMWMMSMGNKLARTMTSEHIRLLHLVKVMISVHLFAVFTGFVIFKLMDEFAGFTKNNHRLTLNMWERIQQLEDEVKELKGHTQVDGQQIDERDSRDSDSGPE